MYFSYKKICFILLILSAVLLLSSGVWAREAADEQQPKQKRVIRHVIMVTFDGVTEKELKNSYTPNLNGLASSGIYAPGMDILPPEASYHLAAVLSGADTEISGFDPEAGGLKTDVLPGIFKKYGHESIYVAARNNPAKTFFNAARESLRFQTAAGGDSVVIEKAIEQFEKNKPYFMGVVLSGAKKPPATGAAHHKAIEETDEQLGRLLLKLRTMEVYDESLIIVTGSSNKETAEIQDKYGQMMVPVVMSGPGLKSGAKLAPVRIIDVAPTIALLTAVAMPGESNGIVIWDGLLAGEGFQEENLLQKRVQDLSQEFMKSSWDIYQLQEEKRTVQAEKEKIRKEKQVIQNIINRKDGKIKSLAGKIRIMQFAGLLILIICGAGYVLEYKFLKKKFLMF